MKPSDSEKTLIWVIVCIAVCALLWLIGLGMASAVERRMSTTQCTNIANDIYVIAQMRDLQKDQAEVAMLVERVLSPHLGEEDSYIQYQSDIQLMVDLVKPIYESQMTPEQIAEMMFDVCQKSGFGVDEV
jgi:uncharacterized protein YsxB (DUF464 family)